MDKWTLLCIPSYLIPYNCHRSIHLFLFIGFWSVFPHSTAKRYHYCDYRMRYTVYVVRYQMDAFPCVSKITISFQCLVQACTRWKRLQDTRMTSWVFWGTRWQVHHKAMQDLTRWQVPACYKSHAQISYLILCSFNFCTPSRMAMGSWWTCCLVVLVILLAS